MAGDGDPTVWMTPAELAEIGRGLYGRYGWQSKLARDLDVDPRYVRRWYAGDARIQRDTAYRIRALAQRQGLIEQAGNLSYHEALARLADAPQRWRIERGPDGTLRLFLVDNDKIVCVYRAQNGRFEPA